jgi:hypothetical protein
MRLFAFALLCAFGVCLVISGCATAPQTDLPAFQEAERFAADKALIVIYRDTRYYGSMLLMPVTCDGVPVVSLPKGAALQYLVEPGLRTFEATMQGAQAPVRNARLTVTAKPGLRYFVRAAPSIGMTTIDLVAELVPEGQARAELRTLRMVTGPRGEPVLVEPQQKRPQAAAAARTGEEAFGNVPGKIGALLRTGTPLRLVVIMPEKDVTYHGPAFAMPLADWKRKMASEIMAAFTGMSLQAFGDAAGFSVVNRENVQDILREFELQGSEAFDQQSTARVGRMVGASHMLLLAFSRENVAGSRYRDIRTARLIDLERNTILALDELADDMTVNAATQGAVLIESRLNGRRFVEDPESRRWYYAE